MRYPNTGQCAFDTRMLTILGTLYDVQSAPKAAMYMNTSSKNKVDTLIARGFILESPVPFSNKRLCSITPRGRTLFELLTVLEAVWTSDPDAEFRFNLSYDTVPDREVPDGEESLTETALDDTNDHVEVPDILSTSEPLERAGIVDLLDIALSEGGEDP